MMHRLLLAAIVLVAAAAPAAAQCLPPLLPPEEPFECRERYPSWTGEMASFGVNALLGGLSAGILQELKDGSFRDGFLDGLLGGAVIYGGKRISAERFGGAGLVGRQVAAVGASIVRNSGEGRSRLEQVRLPVGPVWLHLQSSAPRVRATIDVYTAGWMLRAIAEPALSFHTGMSVSAGALVFVTDNQVILSGTDTTHALGIAEAGVLLIADIPAFGRQFARRTFEHERVHVLQMDQIFLTITDPIEDAAVDQLPYVRRLNRYVELNMSSLLLRLLNGQIPKHLDRPWETEAIFFSR